MHLMLSWLGWSFSLIKLKMSRVSPSLNAPAPTAFTRRQWEPCGAFCDEDPCFIIRLNEWGHQERVLFVNVLTMYVGLMTFVNKTASPTKLSQPVHPSRARVLIPTGQPASQPSMRCLTHWEHRAYDAPYTGSTVKMGWLHAFLD